MSLFTEKRKIRILIINEMRENQTHDLSEHIIENIVAMTCNY